MNSGPIRAETIVPAEFKPDWVNASTCIDNAIAAYDDSVCMRSDDDEDEAIPVNTDIMSGDLSVLIGLASAARGARNIIELATRNGHTAEEILEMVVERLGMERGSQ